MPDELPVPFAITVPSLTVMLPAIWDMPLPMPELQKPPVECSVPPPSMVSDVPVSTRTPGILSPPAIVLVVPLFSISVLPLPVNDRGHVLPYTALLTLTLSSVSVTLSPQTMRRLVYVVAGSPTSVTASPSEMVMMSPLPCPCAARL